MPNRGPTLSAIGWHGITATSRQVKPLSRSIGDTLLPGEAQIGMLVMGAYSHSRVRELLLGGMTRRVLSNVAARPVLMAESGTPVGTCGSRRGGPANSWRRCWAPQFARPGCGFAFG